MQRLTIYSSAPVGAKLACAFQLLAAALNLLVEEKPLSELPSPTSPPRRRCTLLDDLERVTVRLAEIGDQLNDHENGKCRLSAGLEAGLRAERDGLQSRQRGILASTRAQEGGRPDA